MKTVNIYTDGACRGNPGDGGWGVLMEYESVTKEYFGGEKNTTNNRMELMAPIAALSKITKKKKVQIFTDSQYVKMGITNWIHNWIKNNWQTSKKEDVKNKDLWLNLYKLTQSLDIEWHWVKAHAGNTLNEEVDALAKDAAKSN